MKDSKNFALDMLREDAPTTRTERLYDRIRQMILSGALAPGYTFPNENDMCQQLQIGRGTLREVYQSLLSDGLIRRSKAGTIVNGRQEIVRQAPFSVVVNYASFQDIFEFRMMLETEMVRITATRATDQELREIGAILSGGEEAQREGRLQEVDLAFHKAMAEYSHNPLLINVFHDVWTAFESLLLENHKTLRLSSPHTLEDAVRHHQTIYDALLRRDPDGAQQAMKEHLYAVCAQTLQNSP